VHLLVKTVDMV